MKKKKPDSVVYDDNTENYDAYLKPYATNLGAPVITTTDTAAWKNTNIHKVNKHVKARYDELKSQYDALIKEFEYNNLIYNAKFNFEPIVGKTYHLYIDKKEQSFLSIIAPAECTFKHLGSFRLNADKIWKSV